MSDAGRERIWDLFDRALELSDDQRKVLLDRECESDSSLRREVESLLRHANEAHSQAEDFLKSPLVRSSEHKTSEPVPSLPERIGRYRIIGLLGSGAMGSVYEAEQETPQRSVAVKVLHRSCVSPDMRRRFLKESHILGQLRHKGIAQIYDAGVDDTGLPYFVMELIRGQLIDEYANSQYLSLSERMSLMATVCDAVDHAHQRGVIHRDLKPSNILVDDIGQCKVLDFGIARTSDSELISITSHTETGQLLGTLSYMSPEQVSAKASEIDARTDVYALGLVLYELVSGARAYQLNHLPLPEVARTIREKEPPLLGTLDRRFRGDIETIVCKSLEKDKTRRYASAGALRDDILRHLAHQSIHARPASAFYRLKKFSRRNRTVLTIVCLLILGLIGTSGFAGLALHKSRVADNEKAASMIEAYVARLSVASAALEDFDASTAKIQLNATPPQLRGWEWRHLASRLDTSQRQQLLSPQHEARVASFSDGMCVQHSNDRSTSIRDCNDREIMQINYPWPVSYVSSVAMRGAEARVYVVTEERHLIITQSGRVLVELSPPRPRLGRAVAFSRDLRLFAVAWYDHGYQIELYELETGKKLRTLQGHRGRIYGLSFSNLADQIASSGEDGSVRVWETESGKMLQDCRGHTGNVWHVSFSPDGERLVSASADGTVRQWSTETGQEISKQFDRHQGDVTIAVYSPDGSRIASCAHDRTIRVWNASDQSELMVLYGERPATTLGFAADGQLVGVGDRTSIVRFWNVASDEASPWLLQGHTKSIYPIQVSPDGAWIASGGWDNKVNVWNAQTGRLMATKQTSAPVKSLCFTPDSSSVITIDSEVPYFRRWNFHTDEVVAEKVVDALREVPATLALSPDGKQLAAAGLAGAQVWELATGKLIKTLSTWDCYAHKLAFSPDGKWLIGPGPGVGATSLWSTQSYQLHAQLRKETPGELNFAVAFSPDSRLAATGARDSEMQLWEVASGKLLQVLPGHTDEIFAIAFHPTEPRMASAGRDRLIQIWDLNSGKVMASLKGHKSYVWSLAYANDGETLVSGGGDTTIRLWSTRSARDMFTSTR